ncbi:hypothetical protein Tco_1559428 [Tanacetum coccineum]
MLVPGNYVEWKFRIKRYIDTKPNHELIHFCLKNPPYQYKFKATDVDVTPATPGNDGTPQQPQPRGEVMKIFATVSEDIQKWITAEVEAIQIILTGIDNDIYSTVDACPNAMEIWKSIERLKQGETINVQDLETNLYWEFRKFTLQEGETLDSYYSCSESKDTLTPNHELIHFCLKNPPYQYKFKATDVDVTPATPGNDGTPQQPQPRGEVMKIFATVSEDIQKWITAEVEAIQIILTGIDNDIYSTVDACPNAIEMWKAIERLKQVESINVQDLEINLYWEFV